MKKNVVKNIVVFGFVFIVLLFGIIPLSNVHADFSDGTGIEQWAKAFSKSLGSDTKSYIDKLVIALTLNKFGTSDKNEGKKLDDIKFSSVGVGKYISSAEIIDEKGDYILENIAKYDDMDYLKSIVANIKDIIRNSDDENIKDLEQKYKDGKLTADEKKYYEGTLEALALETLANYIKGDGYIRQILTDLHCVSSGNVTSADGKEIQQYSIGPGTIDGSVVGGTSSLTYFMTCDDTKDILDQLQKQVIKQKQSRENDVKVTGTTGRVSDEVKKNVAGLTSSVIAGIEAGEQVLGEVRYKDLNTTTGVQLSIKIDDLLQRVLDAGDEKNEGITKLSEIVGTLVEAISSIGRYIMYALILFFGVRIIWSGAQAKSQFKEMLPFLLVGIIFFWAAPSLVNLGIDIFKIDNASSTGYMGRIWGTVLEIVRILAFSGIVFTGVKIIFSNADQKAEIKSGLIAVLIGSIIVFAASTVIKVVLNVAKGTGIDYTKTVESVKID